MPSPTSTQMPPGYISLPYNTDFSEKNLSNQNNYNFIVETAQANWYTGQLLLQTGSPRKNTIFKDPFGSYFYCKMPNCDGISFNPMINEFTLSFLARTYKDGYEGANGFPPSGSFDGAWYLRFLGGPESAFYLIVDDGYVFTRGNGFAVFYTTGPKLQTVIPWTGFGYYNSGIATDKPSMSAWRINIYNGKAMIYFNEGLLSQFDIKDTGDTWVSFGELSSLSAPVDVGTLIDDLQIIK